MYTRISLLKNVKSLIMLLIKSLVNYLVCKLLTAYSLSYSFILGFDCLSLIDFCLSLSDNSCTRKQLVPHTTYSSRVSQTNLYCSWNRRKTGQNTGRNYTNTGGREAMLVDNTSSGLADFLFRKNLSTMRNSILQR